MQSNSRQAYLDWLRIIAIIAVLFFHSAMPFTGETWHIVNKQSSSLFDEFIVFLHRFRMPLLFFISGTVSYFMMQKRSSASFIALRFRRLFIPLLLGMLIIVPPQVYMERVTNGYKGSFFDFYPTIFTTGAYPNGNLSWHHLWFIVYLLVYDIICAPLFSWLISEKGKVFMTKFNAVAKGKWIYVIMIPGILIYGFFSYRYPATNDLVHDYAYFFYWLCFLLAGFFCIANPSLMNSLERNRRISFALALITVCILNYLRWNNLHSWDGFPYLATSSLCAWSWVLTAVGYGKKYLNKRFKVMDYLNQAVYPFYILHQTVIVIIAYYVVRTNDEIALKYAFIVVLTFIISVSIFHLFIRPFRVMRFLFGMKDDKAKDTGVREQKQQEAPAVLSVS